MTSGLFGLQKVKDIHGISAIGWAFFKVRKVACTPLFSHWRKWEVLILLHRPWPAWRCIT